MAEVVVRRRMREADRRRVILDAATTVVAERGADGASISEIAERAGITRPIVYDHFPTKQHLVLALIEEHHATLMALLGALPAGTRLDEALFRGLLTMYFEQVDVDPGGWRILCLEPSRDQVIADVQRRTAREVNVVFAELLDPATPMDQRLLAAEAVRAAVNALAAVRQDDPSVSIAALVEAAIALLWDGLTRH